MFAQMVCCSLLVARMGCRAPLSGRPWAASGLAGVVSALSVFGVRQWGADDRGSKGRSVVKTAVHVIRQKKAGKGEGEGSACPAGGGCVVVPCARVSLAMSRKCVLSDACILSVVTWESRGRCGCRLAGGYDGDGFSSARAVSCFDYPGFILLLYVLVCCQRARLRVRRSGRTGGWLRGRGGRRLITWRSRGGRGRRSW